MCKRLKQIVFLTSVLAFLVIFLPAVVQADSTAVYISSPLNGQHYKDGETMRVQVTPSLSGGQVEFKFEYWIPPYNGPAGPPSPGSWVSGHFLLPPGFSSGPTVSSVGVILPVSKSVFDSFGRWRVSARYYDGTPNPWSPWVEFYYDPVVWSKTPPAITTPSPYQHFLTMVKFEIQNPADLPANAETVLDFQYYNNSPVYSYSPITKPPPTGVDYVGKHKFYPGEWKVRAAYRTNGNEMTPWSAWVPFTVDGNLWITFESPKAGAASSNGVTVKTANMYPYIVLPIQIQVAQFANGAWGNLKEFQFTSQELVLGVSLPLKTYFDDSPGKWRIRARHLLYKEANGPWCDWIEFNMTKPVRMPTLP